ncbi:Cell cycle checkpoint control protein RAD9A [Bienertia sinuspersici]
MEASVSGNALKTFARSINCLAKIGNELAIQASSSQVAFCTLNASRSAYQSISYKPDFFDVFTVSSNSQVQFSILLKAVCAVLRTPLSSIDHLRVHLLNTDATKVKWTLDCVNGMRKTYWINCNVEPDIQHLSLEKGRFQSNFVVRPRDLNRLLSNFQSSLHEITVIATEPSSFPSEAESEIGGKAVELRSYIDPSNDTGSSLHTQLWIDPVEEFLQYAHTGNPVDVTFGVKELKAFLSFCEACEVDMHLFFEKAGEPILMTPKFGLDDDGSTSNFDAKLVLATMLTSQLHEGNTAGPVPSDGALNRRANNETGAEVQQERSKVQASAHASDHTKIWSDLSAKSGGGSGSRQVQGEGNTTFNEQRERFDAMRISRSHPERQNVASGLNLSHHTQTNQQVEHQGLKGKGEGFSQRHLSNWVDADEDDDEGEESELCVQSTPPYYEEQ